MFSKYVCVTSWLHFKICWSSQYFDSISHILYYICIICKNIDNSSKSWNETNLWLKHILKTCSKASFDCWIQKKHFRVKILSETLLFQHKLMAAVGISEKYVFLGHLKLNVRNCPLTWQPKITGNILICNKNNKRTY